MRWTNITDLQSQILRNDLTISNQHLRIYSVIYDLNVERFVYAEDLSRNGSYWLYKRNDCWRKLLIGRGNACLLSNGDGIRLCDGSFFVFRSVPLPEHSDSKLSEPLSRLQELERGASYIT